MSIQQNAGVDVLCADAPQMSRAELGMRAVFAEEERRWISDRTRVALAAAKRRGVTLGRPEHLDRAARLLGTAASTRVRGAKAEVRAVDLQPLIEELRTGGASSLGQIAAGLNARGIPAARGGHWRPSQVRRVIRRLAGCAA
jgi:DNA invertase Pin-like site-specific DNA recombinase